VLSTMLMIAVHHDSLSDQRVERIGDHRFEGQKSGTMAPARTRELKTGPASLR
jgi:hypothetical protein